MRIGILTLPLHTNYGGILQAYALQTVLERMGHKTTLLNRVYGEMVLPTWKKPLAYSKRVVWKYVLRKPKRIFYERYFNNVVYPTMTRNTQPFIDKHIHYEWIRDFNSLSNKDFDAIVVGSDQIWRPMYFKLDKLGFAPFLQFAKTWNIKRIAYAASFGAAEWEYSKRETKVCRDLAKMFDAVSVRENSGIDLCKEYLGVNAQHVLDPTMLLDAEDYIRLCVDTPKSEGDLLNYTLDETEEKVKIVNAIASKRGLKPFNTNNPNIDRPKAPLADRVQYPVEHWLRGFYDAEFVFTDSFHACVFSILFKKQFVVYGNKERGMARFESLLKMFGLENRLISNVEDLNNLGDIDYDQVYEKLNNMRNMSMSYLQNTLSK